MTFVEDPPIEKRRIFVVDNEYWMELTAEEFLQWKQEAPNLIHYVNGVLCSRVYRKMKES